MKITQKFIISSVAAVMLVGLVSCADMTRQENTAVGAGVGAVGGAILTNGSPAGIVGGAIVGGVIGHESSRYNERYPADRYYYHEADGRYYQRDYQRSHRNVRCNDGVVLRA
jgi:osmotically inducible lipoprotein OsmB